MNLLRPLCCLSLLLNAVSCKTQRTVLAGPTQTGADAQGLKDSKSWSTSYQSDKSLGRDSGGYEQNSSGGLNAMSEKMFGGKLQSQSQKEFTANKNFLTREYGGKKDFAAKSWQGEPQNKTWTDKLFDTQDSAETQTVYQEGTKQAAIKDSPEATKTARTGDYAGATKTARTSNYRPAEQALNNGRDEPKLASARSDRMSSEEKRVHDRIANSNATASDINKYLGKP